MSLKDDLVALCDCPFWPWWHKKFRKLPMLDLVGPYSMLEKYVKYCNLVLETPLTTKINKHDTIFRVTISGKKALFLIKHFYLDSTIYMDRKYNSALEVIEYSELNNPTINL